MVGPFKDRDFLVRFMDQEVVSTAEAMEILQCSRQNLHGFVKRGKLLPIKETNRERLFLRSEVLERKEEAAKYNRRDKSADAENP